MLSGARLYARPLELKLDRRFVAHMEEPEYVFLKTIIPSRKATRDYGEKGEI